MAKNKKGEFDIDLTEFMDDEDMEEFMDDENTAPLYDEDTDPLFGNNVGKIPPPNMDNVDDIERMVNAQISVSQSRQPRQPKPQQPKMSEQDIIIQSFLKSTKMTSQKFRFGIEFPDAALLKQFINMFGIKAEDVVTKIVNNNSQQIIQQSIQQILSKLGFVDMCEKRDVEPQNPDNNV